MNKNKNSTATLSLRSRYGLLFSALVAIVIIINLCSLLFMDNIHYKITQNTLIKDCDEIVNIIEESDSFYKDIANCEALNNIYIEIYKPKDNLIYSTNNNDWIYDSSLDDNTEDDDSSLKPRIMKILSHKDVTRSSYFELRQEYFAKGQYLVYSRSENDRTIEIYYSVDTIKSSTKTSVLTIFTTSIIFLFVTMGLTHAYMHAFVIPIDKINSVTKKIANIEFDETCPTVKIKELNELSESVNALSASLSLTLKDLKSKNKMLENGIERERRLDESRRQFISNASHELKTPITIIQGYAEGLKLSIDDGSPEEYADIIIDEAEKMDKLVLRLLEVTRYESDGYRLNNETFSIADFLNEYFAPMDRYIKKNNITYCINCDDSYFGYGDKDLLFDVLGNYVSNAISHCAGERRIEVNVAEHDSVYTVSVFNSGNNISHEDMEHIWESFYRADKAHSRAQGRFGLGLSIVAFAQQQMNQKYGVTNRENGVEFWFNIEKGKKENK